MSIKQNVPAVKIARGVVQQVRFTATRAKVTARTKGLNPITVRKNKEGSRFTATSNVTSSGRKFVLSVEAGSPRGAFAKAVRSMWKPIASN